MKASPQAWHTDLRIVPIHAKTNKLVFTIGTMEEMKNVRN